MRVSLIKAFGAATLALTTAFATPLFDPVPAEAREQIARLSEGEQETVERVERYLNGIETVQARFVQTSSNGAVAEGDLYLSRPGRLRFEYDDPHPALIVANYGQLLYVDRELRETTYLPLRETPVWFLVRDQIRLLEEEELEVAGVSTRPGVVEVALVQEGGEAGEPGSLTLVFSDQPLELRKWTLIDQQNVTTEVALYDARFGQRIDGKLFDFGELDIPRVGPGSRRPDDGS